MHHHISNAEEDGEGGDSRRCLPENQSQILAGSAVLFCQGLTNPPGDWDWVGSRSFVQSQASSMASFVTEVLASSGKLEKEDLAGKISKMSRKVEDIKVNAWAAWPRLCKVSPIRVC